MEDLPLAQEIGIAKPFPETRTFVEAIRGPERVVLIFLLYAAALAMVLPVEPPVTNLIVRVNVALILSYAVLIRVDHTTRKLATGITRDWLPLAVLILAYREVGWLAMPHPGHVLESRWIIWDRQILHGGAKAIVESLGPVVPSALEIAYSVVYALAPFSLTVLYLYHRRNRADTFLFIFTLSVLLCYAQLPFWPSEPPRVVFFGQDLPAYETIFRRFNLWMLGNYGIHTGVFPSAHVAGAFSAAFGMRRALPEHKWVGRFLLVMAFLIAAATFYGRYHYAVDAAAGFLLAVFVDKTVAVRRLYAR
jgi:membrane-associated phospholipid phosphatase